MKWAKKNEKAAAAAAPPAAAAAAAARKEGRCSIFLRSEGMQDAPLHLLLLQLAFFTTQYEEDARISGSRERLTRCNDDLPSVKVPASFSDPFPAPA